MNREETRKELANLSTEWKLSFLSRIDLLIFSFLSEDIKQSEILDLLILSTAIEFIYDPENTEFLKNEKNKLYTEEISFHKNRLFIIRSRSEDIVELIDAKLDFLIYSKSGYASGKITDYAELLQIDMSSELYFIKEHIQSGKSTADYLYQPLYASQSQEWLQRGKEFVQILRNYGHGFDIWADWFQGRIDGVPTNKEFLEAVANLPEEILAQEPAQINAYIKNLCQTERPLNRVRVIFLGYGEAGKTSLIRALNSLEVVAGKEQMTPGIDISTWQVPGTEITAHFWDFGGQVVAHATHQFFLRSRCLYILLLDGRTEINANEQAEYWLEHVRAFGSKAPVMLVGNKADLCAVNLVFLLAKKEGADCSAPSVKNYWDTISRPDNSSITHTDRRRQQRGRSARHHPCHPHLSAALCN
ncbi:MAG: Ras of Complex, Roc, domain of DAPkinase [Candidatus Electronema aureum]|uniref:Ras of Complex, Roc, domain of DAPkinase n=1 Tax=Candidatus Electronema aureum TaxID=2005002 RepID=A0A521FZG7_9BACT|nr:MAG: Ras of Complex, Roc, domain of DAPkinase [Candidatus Electronema aureum]